MPKDNSPVGYTCPMIDEIIDFIKNCSTENEIEKKEAINVMEKIRTANDKLRTWGNEMFDEKEDYEKEKNQLENEVEELKEEIKSLEKEINNLED